MFHKKSHYASTPKAPAANTAEPTSITGRICQHVSNMPARELAMAGLLGAGALALLAGVGYASRK